MAERRSEDDLIFTFPREVGEHVQGLLRNSQIRCPAVDCYFCKLSRAALKEFMTVLGEGGHRG